MAQLNLSAAARSDEKSDLAPENFGRTKIYLSHPKRPGQILGMPYLSIQTNSTLSAEKRNELLSAASEIVGAQLNKPESSVMAGFQPVPEMMLAKDDAPAAFLELRSIGVPDAKRHPLCAALTELISRSCGISAKRVFIVLVDVQARFWAYDGAMVG